MAAFVVHCDVTLAAVNSVTSVQMPVTVSRGRLVKSHVGYYCKCTRYVRTRNVCNGNISNVGALHFSILLFVRVSRCARRVQFGRCSVIVHVFAGGWKAFPPVSSKRSVLIGGIRTCSNPVHTVTSPWNVITSKSTVTVLSWPPALFSIANSSRRSKTDYWVTSYTSKTRAMT